MIYLFASAVIAGLFALIAYQLHGMAFVAEYNYIITGIVVAGILVAGCSVTPTRMCRYVKRLHLPFLCRGC